MRLGLFSDILEARIPDRTVWIFGSRAKNRARRRSDLDLAICRFRTPFPLIFILDLKEVLRCNPTYPIVVDLIDLHDVAPDFSSSRIEPDFRRRLASLLNQILEQMNPRRGAFR